MVKNKRGSADLPFFALVILLTVIGLVMLFSASYVKAQKDFGYSAYYLIKQGGFALAGIFIMWVLSRVNYRIFFDNKGLISLGVMGAAILFLVLVPFIGTDNGTDATRWLPLGPLTFQPSEIAKLGVIMLFAYLMTRWNQEAFADTKILKIHRTRYTFGLLVILGLISFLLVLEPHLSGTIIILAIGLVMMFAGGVRWSKTMSAAALGLAIAGYSATFNEKIMSALAASDNKIIMRVVSRVGVWHDPFIDPQGDGYQLIQSWYALGSGGLLGVGLGQSRQKYPHLPEQFNDFIMAVIGEELGFVGLCLIILLFIILITRGYMIAVNCRDTFGMLLTVGIVTQLAIQTAFNIGVVSGALPTTGISMPFFSYGGTSLIIQLAEMGVVLSVSRNIPES
ncbi:stage V sporulation protein E [Clostridia bacterium]|nr:stage V sporulation protein E [Clostridia bacterium]